MPRRLSRLPVCYIEAGPRLGFMWPILHPVHKWVNKAAASCAILGCRLGPRASFRYSPFTSPMFTVHLADVHSAPCIVYNSPYTMSREYASSCLYLLLTVQHTQLLAIWLSFTSTRQLQHGIATNGHNSGNGRTPRVWVLKNCASMAVKYIKSSVQRLLDK